MVDCNQRGSRMLCGEFSHTFLFEQGGTAQVLQVWQSYFHKVLVIFHDDLHSDLGDSASDNSSSPAV